MQGLGLGAGLEAEPELTKLKPHRVTFAMNLKLRLQLQCRGTDVHFGLARATGGAIVCTIEPEREPERHWHATPSSAAGPRPGVH